MLIERGGLRLHRGRLFRLDASKRSRKPASNSSFIGNASTQSCQIERRVSKSVAVTASIARFPDPFPVPDPADLPVGSSAALPVGPLRSRDKIGR